MIQTFIEYKDILLEGFFVTLYMTFSSAAFSYLLGLPLGVLLTVTGKNGIAENQKFYTGLSWVVNIGRSVPFVILIMALTPFARLLVGKSIGPNAAIVSLVVAATPFVARLIEGHLTEVDSGVVEAAVCMGATKWQIVYKVLLSEAFPAIIRGFSLTAITLIGYSAIAGTVGAGGLGDIAIRYGYHRMASDVMWVTLVILVIIVAVIQGILGLTAQQIDKKNKT
jgi:ABC-type metal ion transport system, permease component